MKKIIGASLGLAIVSLSLSWTAGSQEQKSPMTFFITSVGLGKGADLGGVAGADKHCQALAQAAGAGDRTWRAYLSSSPADGKPAVNGRDRIGRGPWHNAKGVLIAKDVEDLHGDNKIDRDTALSEKGERINARGDKPNMHDILTGSQRDGTAFTGSDDRTCRNWTSSGEGAAMVGHHDRMGVRDDEASRSWNCRIRREGAARKPSAARAGTVSSYCFAAN